MIGLVFSPIHTGLQLMDSLLIRHHLSRNILIRLLLFSALGAGLLYWNLDFINSIYFRNQLTQTGYLINGAIAALFLFGILRITLSLLSYAKEESALFRFINNIQSGKQDSPLYKVEKSSLIAARYQTMMHLHQALTPINQSALAATLVAAESTRNSSARFINNTLILTGVFGTIVSLSLALLGASDLLKDSVNVGGMGIVIHGMSTALSTTITAIISYLFFGYFHMKLSDVQTNLLSGIEQVTTLHLMPTFEIKPDNAVYEFTGLLRSAQELMEQMRDTQEGLAGVEQKALNLLEEQARQSRRYNDSLEEIKETLIRGFRLDSDQ